MQVQFAQSILIYFRYVVSDSRGASFTARRGLPGASGFGTGFPAMSLDLQPVRAEDEAFLFELSASTCADEMALVGWDKQQETMLCSPDSDCDLPTLPAVCRQ